MEYAHTSPNKRLARLSTGQDTAPVRAVRVPQNASRRTKARLCGILLHHILPALQNFGFAYSGWQNVANLECYV